MSESNILKRNVKSKHLKAVCIDKRPRIKSDMKIVIKDFSTKCGIVNAKHSDKVIDIKKKLSNKSGLKPSYYNLYFNGSQINDTERVIDLGLNDLCTIDMLCEFKGGMNISVKTVEGKIYTFEVKLTETVREIKNKIHEKSGVAPNRQKLVFKGSMLNNDETLEELNVTSQSIVNMVIISSDDIRIFVRVPDRETLELRVQKSDKIKEVKEKISKAIGMSVNTQTLLFHSKILHDDKALSTYDVEDDDVVDLASSSSTNIMIYLFIGFAILFLGFELRKWLY